MSNTIIISPWSKRMRNGERNPKNYPYWKEVVSLLKSKGYYTIQVGITGEEEIGADRIIFDHSLDVLTGLIKDCYTWISVDNFFQHLGYLLDKKGVVIFGQSDPLIFGHNTNVNLLKDRKYLRELQFDIWERCQFREECFLPPGDIVKQVDNINL